MATVGTLAINLIARTQAFEREMRRSRKHLTQFQRTAKATQKAVMFYAKSFLIGGGAIYALKRFTDAAMIQEKAERDLQAAVGGSIQSFKQYASQLQKATVYGDEQILSQMAYAKNLGVTTDKLNEAAKAAIGLAAKYRLDLSASMMLIGRASQGQTQMLTRYGIVLDETLTTEEKFNELLRLGADAFRLAEAEAQTAEGTFKQFSNTTGDLAEQIGDVLLPELVKSIREMNTFMQEYSSGIRRYLSDFREGVEIAQKIQAIMRQAIKPPWLLAYEGIKGRGGKGAAGPRITDEAAWQRALAFQKKMQAQAKPTGTTPQSMAEGMFGAPGTDGGAAISTRKTFYQRYLEQLQHDMNNWTDYMKDQWAGLAMDAEGAMGNMFANMIQDGKNWRDHMAGFFNDIARAASQMAGQAVARQLFGSIIGGVAGGAAGGTTSGSVWSQPHHQGGIVGQMSARRRVSAAMFLGAPRLHGGLRSDEVPAILQKGEQVIPKNEVGGGGPVNLNFYSHDPDGAYRLFYNNRKVIANMMTQARNENHTYGREQR